MSRRFVSSSSVVSSLSRATWLLGANCGIVDDGLDLAKLVNESGAVDDAVWSQALLEPFVSFPKVGKDYVWVGGEEGFSLQDFGDDLFETQPLALAATRSFVHLL